MKIDFWIDPICPWCWLTSRWLVRDVLQNRDVEVNWRPISLMFKNNPSEDSEYYGPVKMSLGLLRIMTTLENQADVDKFYTAAGELIHNNHRGADVTAEEILTNAGLDVSLAEHANDESLDATIRSEMDAGLALVGQDVGTPIIGFEHNGKQIGIFGPVISKVPPQEESLEMWDAMVSISKMESFWELKRTRTEDPNFDY